MYNKRTKNTDTIFGENIFLADKSTFFGYHCFAFRGVAIPEPGTKPNIWFPPGLSLMGSKEKLWDWWEDKGIFGISSSDLEKMRNILRI